MTMILLLLTFVIIAGSHGLLHQISSEKPIDFRIRLCSHERQPMQMETMLFFPDSVKFCASLTTNKNVLQLSKDRQRTTFLQPLLSIAIKEIGAQHRCKINYMGYGGQYRLSPDLGYYNHCQRSISQYINQLVDGEPKPEWNASSSQCPIQDLPNSYKDYLACDLVPMRWYELEFESSIRYEVFHKKTYQQFTSNYSTTFLFKPDLYLEKNGTEIDWLTRLVEIKAKLNGCKKVRYLIRIDDQWKLPVTVHIEYRITDGGFIKYSHHVGSGTIEHWFSGSFPFIKSPSRDHEVCVRVEWQNSRQSFWLCRRFASRGQCNFNSTSTNLFSLKLFIILNLFSLFFLNNKLQ